VNAAAVLIWALSHRFSEEMLTDFARILFTALNAATFCQANRFWKAPWDLSRYSKNT
jgi:hypothetical protein